MPAVKVFEVKLGCSHTKHRFEVTSTGGTDATMSGNCAECGEAWTVEFARDLFTVGECPRCAHKHPDLVGSQLDDGPWISGDQINAAATCPETGQPILLVVNHYKSAVVSVH